MREFNKSIIQVVGKCTAVLPLIGKDRRPWRGLPAALWLVSAVLAAIPATAQTDPVVGAKFSIASGWVGFAAATDGSNFLVALESDKTADKVAAQLISASGAKIGSVIALGTDGQSCCAVGVAFDGTNYLVTWGADQGIKNGSSELVYGQFINTAGTKVGQAIAMTTAGIWYDGLNMLAYGGGKYLITYTRLIDPTKGGDSTNTYVAGRIVTPDGFMGSEFRISTGYGSDSNVTFDGTNFFVVWQQSSPSSAARGRFVSTTGTVGQEVAISSSPDISSSPVVDFDDTNYLVAWSQSNGSGAGVFGQLVSTTGALVGGAITGDGSGQGNKWVTGIAFDGSNHLVTLTDMKNDANGNNVCDSNEGTCWDVYGRYVGKGGSLASSKFVINADAGNQMGSVTCAGGKCLAVISSGFTMASGGPSQVGEVYGHFLTSQASTLLLSVTPSGTGYGNVGSTPSGISCYVPQPGVAYLVAPDCSESLASGTSVSLTASPASGSIFIAWSGDCTGTGTCTVNMNAARNVTATFISTSASSGADCVFNWAERTYPQFFAPTGEGSLIFESFYYRVSLSTGNYLALYDNHLWVIGPVTGNSLLDIGPMSLYLTLAGCSP